MASSPTSEPKPVIAVDIDEVLAQFMPTLARFHNDNYNTSLDVEDFRSYKFHEVWGGTVQECSDKMDIFFNSSYFKNDLIQVPSAFNILNELKNTYDLHVVTARHDGIAEHTKFWINANYPDIFTDIHFGNHYAKEAGKSVSKSELCKKINAILLIDDSPIYAKDCADNFLPCILFGDYPWNRYEYNSNLATKYAGLIYRTHHWNEMSSLIDKVLNDHYHQMQLAAIQMTSTNNKQTNLETIKRLCEKAVNENRVELIALPECCVFIGTSVDETLQAAESLHNSQSVDYLCQIAKSLNIYLHVGGFHTLDSVDNGEGGNSNKISNTSLLINKDGTINNQTIYKKIHLFDSPRHKLYESHSTTCGNDIVVFELNSYKVASSICYDLRFSELYAKQRELGADIIMVPAAFTVETGQAHWEILLRARAIENQCYVIAPAQAGKHNEKRVSYGNTLIINPWGDVISRCSYYNSTNESNYEEIAVATVSRNILNQIRNSMPKHSHRKPEIYK